MTDTEMQAVCFDCERPYGDEHGFCDLVVPNDVWETISPTKDSHGLLCPSCMVRRAYAAGVNNVQASFNSGPFCQTTSVGGPDAYC